MVFTSDRQRKAVMAKLTAGTRSDVAPKFTRGVVVVGKKPIFKLQRKIKVTMNGKEKTKIQAFKQMRKERLERELEREARFKPENIKTVADVMSLNAERKRFFFSPDTIKFFNSRIIGADLKGKNKDLFVSSEKQPSIRGETFSRKFTIRKANKVSGAIDTVGEFQQFNTQKQAENFIKNKNL